MNSIMFCIGLSITRASIVDRALTAMVHGLSKVAEGISTYLSSFKSAAPSVQKRVAEVQGHAFINAIKESRLLRSEADEIKRVLDELLFAFKHFPLREVCDEITKVIVMENCVVPVPPAGTRRPMQDFTHIVIYLNAKLVSKITELRAENSADVTMVIQQEIASFAATKLGLRCPSEMTVSVILAASGYGDPQWDTYSPAVLHQLYKACKSTVATVINPVGQLPPNMDFIVRLPSSPLTIPANWYNWAYPDGWDCHATSDVMSKITYYAQKIPCRATSKAIRHPYMVNVMQQPQQPAAMPMESIFTNMMQMMLGFGQQQQQTRGQQPPILQMMRGAQAGGAVSNSRFRALENSISSDQRGAGQAPALPGSAGQVPALANAGQVHALPGSAQVPALANAGQVPALPDVDATLDLEDPEQKETLPLQVSPPAGDEAFADYLQQVEALEQSRTGKSNKSVKKTKAKPKGKAKAKAKGKAKAKAKAAPAPVHQDSAGVVPMAKGKAKAKAKAKANAAPAPVHQDVADEARPLITRLEDGDYLGLPATKAEMIRLWPAGCGKCRRQPGCSPSCWFYRNPDRSED